MPSRKANTARKTPRSQEVFDQAEKSYRDAMSLYLIKRDWTRAKDAFEEFLEKNAEERELAEMNDRVRVHLEACKQRLAPAGSRPTNGSDWLLEAIYESNGGNYSAALEALDRAAASGAAADRVEYARAGSLTGLGRYDDALEALRRAIELSSEHRIYSLSDPDLERLRETAGYVALVDPPTLSTSISGPALTPSFGLAIDDSDEDPYDDEALDQELDEDDEVEPALESDDKDNPTEQSY